MDDEWVSASRALHLVYSASGGQAAMAICSRAADGLVAARAVRLMRNEQQDDDAAIPRLFWWARGQAALKQNWGTGDFSTWIDQKYHLRAYGVRFLRVDIEAMLPQRGPDLPFTQWEPGNYAPAATCLKELCDARDCSEEEGEALLLRHCRAGLVTSRCSSVRWQVSDTYGRTDDEETNVAVPEWFWENCLDGPDTILNWQTGRFAGRGVIDGNSYKAIVTGVEFQVSSIVDIERLPGRAPPPIDRPTNAPSAPPAGRRLSDLWRPWIAELVAFFHEEGVPEGVGSQGQQEVIKAVDDRLAKRGQESLARSTVQPVVQAVLDRIRGAEI